MQQGAHAARNIVRAIEGKPLEAFHYRDYGILATIGRGAAVGDVFGLKIYGFFAWLFWLFLHIFWLIGFRNRIAVMGEWAWAYLTFHRRGRVIPSDKPRSSLRTEQHSLNCRDLLGKEAPIRPTSPLHRP